MTAVERTIQNRRRYFEVDESEMAPEMEGLSVKDLRGALRENAPIKGCVMRPEMGPASQTSEVSSSESPRACSGASMSANFAEV